MHRQLVQTLSEASPLVLAGLSRSCRLLTAPLQIINTSQWRFYYSLDCLDLKLASELQSTPPWTLPNPLCSLFVSYYIYSLKMWYSSATAPFLFFGFFCFFFLNSPPPPCFPSSCSRSHVSSHLACSSSISKQSHFLSTPSFVAVICRACQVEYWATLWPLSTKGRPRKPEGRRYLCVGWIISPTRHSAFSHCLACNRHAACRCQDGSLVEYTRPGACHALVKLTLAKQNNSWGIFAQTAEFYTDSLASLSTDPLDSVQHHFLD